MPGWPGLCAFRGLAALSSFFLSSVTGEKQITALKKQTVCYALQNSDRTPTLPSPCPTDVSTLLKLELLRSSNMFSLPLVSVRMWNPVKMKPKRFRQDTWIQLQMCFVMLRAHELRRWHAVVSLPLFLPQVKIWAMESKGCHWSNRMPCQCWIPIMSGC